MKLGQELAFFHLEYWKSDKFAFFLGYLSHKTLIYGALAKTVTSDSLSELVFESTDAVLWIIPSNMKKNHPQTQKFG